jgi:hypothetical protein
MNVPQRRQQNAEGNGGKDVDNEAGVSQTEIDLKDVKLAGFCRSCVSTTKSGPAKRANNAGNSLNG